MYIHVLLCIGFTLDAERLFDDVLSVLSHFYAPAEASIRYNHVYIYMCVCMY